MAPSNSPEPNVGPVRPVMSGAASSFASFPAPPVTAPSSQVDGTATPQAVLELTDGSSFRGISFGADGKSVAGECVFQTGQSASPDLVYPSSHIFGIRHGGIHRILDRPFV
jgi:Carbamoylphosphate synthase small subunit